MIVRDFEVVPCPMRKEDPTWRFALAASPVSDGHVLRIASDDGVEGFGYASATPHMGSIKDTLAAELALFRPLVVGRDPRAVEAILAVLDCALQGAPQAKAAVEDVRVRVDQQNLEIQKVHDWVNEREPNASPS